MAVSKKKKKGNGRSNQKQVSGGFQTEIILLIILAASVILLVSAFGMGGIVGNTISSFLFGVMGLLAYVFPVFLFIGCAFVLSNRSNPIAYKKILAAFLFFVFFCGLIQLLTEGYMRSTTLGDYYALCSDYRTGGGVIGGAICISTTSAFGIIGGYIIIVLVLMISLILITQKSFFGFLGKILDVFRSAVQGGHERYMEGQPERDLKKELRIQQKQQNRAKKRAERVKRLEQAIAEVEADDDEEYDSQEAEGTEKKQETFKKPAFLEGTKLIPDKPAEPVPEEPEQQDFSKALDASSVERKIAGEDGEDEIIISSRPTSQGQLEFEIHRSEPAQVMPDEEEEEFQTADKEPVPSAGDLVKKRTVKNPKSSQEEIEKGIQNIQQEIHNKEEIPKPEYKFPPLRLLKKGSGKNQGDSDAHLKQTAMKLQEILHTFGVNATVTNVSCGPTVTRYELQPEMGVKVSKIVGLTDDIKLNLAASDIRIEAPIPGKAAVGIEVPNKENSVVMLRDLLATEEFQNAKSRISFAAGKDIGGKPVVADIAKMPHLLIAGATGSGKSVCINTLIISILYKAKPDEVKLIMIDPKVVELSVYNGIPHLFIPVVTDPKKAAGALNWAVSEMTSRYNTFAEYNVRSLSEYNKKVENMRVPDGETPPEKMPQIVIIVDELADLMMVAPGEVEDSIVRLSQLARAAGIHLVIATQRPSVNVITGLIKANMPSRIAFAVTSGVDSRTILDMNGAEKLLGKGDMLFYPYGYQKPARLQGAFVSDEEVSAVVDFLADKNPGVEYDSRIEQQVNTVSLASGGSSGNDRDDYFMEAGKFIIEKDKASIGMLQRMFKIGFNRAARIMDQLCEAGVVGPEEGTKPRKVLMSMEEFEAYLEEYA